MVLVKIELSVTGSNPVLDSCALHSLLKILNVVVEHAEAHE